MEREGSEPARLEIDVERGRKVEQRSAGQNEVSVRGWGVMWNERPTCEVIIEMVGRLSSAIMQEKEEGERDWEVNQGMSVMKPDSDEVERNRRFSNLQ